MSILRKKKNSNNGEYPRWVFVSMCGYPSYYKHYEYMVDDQRYSYAVMYDRSKRRWQVGRWTGKSLADFVTLHTRKTQEGAMAKAEELHSAKYGK